jgi:hypothetical protein
MHLQVCVKERRKGERHALARLIEPGRVWHSMVRRGDGQGRTTCM